MDQVSAAVEQLKGRGVSVLSPAEPYVVAEEHGFLFVASDPVRCIRLVQDRHLAAIQASDFLWLVCPGGYIGLSAAMEIGFAVSAGVPVFSLTEPGDITMREYVRTVESMDEALS